MGIPAQLASAHTRNDNNFYQHFTRDTSSCNMGWLFLRQYDPSNREGKG